MKVIECSRCGNVTKKIYTSTQHIPFGHRKGYLCLKCAEEDYAESNFKLSRYIDGLREALAKRRSRLGRLKQEMCEHDWKCTDYGKNDFKNKVFLVGYVCKKCGKSAWFDYDKKFVEYDND